jgi:hypothetical protein
MTARRPRAVSAARVEPFNPLDYANLTKNVVEELMRQQPVCLPPEPPFMGGGVYALFYVGDDPEYEPFRSVDATEPIYVGKAAPAGARKGVATDLVVRTELYGRLAEHAKSIDAAENLNLDDFLCRYLVVVPLWISMAETFLITNFKPLWNLRLDGFGNHDPGSGRHQSEISPWDAHHPGRAWARRLRQTRDRDMTKEIIRDFARQRRENPGVIAALAEEAKMRELAEDANGAQMSLADVADETT